MWGGVDPHAVLPVTFVQVRLGMKTLIPKSDSRSFTNVYRIDLLVALHAYMHTCNNDALPIAHLVEYIITTIDTLDGIALTSLLR